MKIGMILDRPFPPDHRVEKEASSLIAAGNEVHLFCFKHTNELSEENIKGLIVHRFKMPKWRYKKLSALINVIPFYNRFWFHRLDQKINKLEIEAIHVHDLPLSKVAMKLRSKYNIPVIIDMHEDFADWIIETPHYNTVIGKIVKNASRWKKYEGKYLRLADYIIGVSPFLIEKMKKEHNLNKDKFIFVPNTPDINFMDLRGIDDDIRKQMNNRFNLIYVGGISYLRGLQNVIMYMKKLKELIPDIQLVIVGDGSYRTSLENIVAKHKLNDYIFFAGWQKINRVSAYIFLSHVGLYPSLRYKGVDEKVPTKIFQYWAQKKPVIASDYQFPRELITRYKAGLTMDYENESDKFTEYVLFFYKNEEQRIQMGINGRQAIERDWNWEQTVKPLVNLYNQ